MDALRNKILKLLETNKSPGSVPYLGYVSDKAKQYFEKSQSWDVQNVWFLAPHPFYRKVMLDMIELPMEQKLDLCRYIEIEAYEKEFHVCHDDSFDFQALWALYNV